MTPSANEVDEALDTLRKSLDADGFELSVVSIIEPGEVVVRLSASTDACLDCLVPDTILIRLVADAIRRRETDVARVRLTFENFGDKPDLVARPDQRMDEK